MNGFMRSKWLLGAVLAYALFLVATLPASVLSKSLASRGIVASSFDGSLWSGRATALRAGVLNLGDVQWQIRFLPLFTGRLAVDLSSKQDNGYFTGRLALLITGSVVLSDVSASLPLQTLFGNGGMPGGWTGILQARFERIQLDNRWPAEAMGSLDVIDFTGPASEPSNIGAYRIAFPADGSNDQQLLGTLNSRDGAALGVVGTLTLKADRNYQLDTFISTRTNTPASLAKLLEGLGTPDANGRRPFSLAGSF